MKEMCNFFYLMEAQNEIKNKQNSIVKINRISKICTTGRNERECHPIDLIFPIVKIKHNFVWDILGNFWEKKSPNIHNIAPVVHKNCSKHLFGDLILDFNSRFDSNCVVCFWSYYESYAVSFNPCRKYCCIINSELRQKKWRILHLVDDHQVSLHKIVVCKR